MGVDTLICGAFHSQSGEFKCRRLGQDIADSAAVDIDSARRFDTVENAGDHIFIHAGSGIRYGLVIQLGQGHQNVLIAAFFRDRFLAQQLVHPDILNHFRNQLIFQFLISFHLQLFAEPDHGGLAGK